MDISAQVSVYPLRQERLTPAIEAVAKGLRAHGLAVKVGPMSTRVVGADEAVFAALKDAFMRAADLGHVVMTVAVSNACQIPDHGDDHGT